MTAATTPGYLRIGSPMSDPWSLNDIRDVRPDIHSHDFSVVESSIPAGLTLDAWARVNRPAPRRGFLARIIGL